MLFKYTFQKNILYDTALIHIKYNANGRVLKTLFIEMNYE